MIKNRRKLILLPLLLVCILISSLFLSGASVDYSEENRGDGESVFVAGNPDLYPLESYNSKTGRYEGVLPMIYEKISEDTGITFTYIYSSSENKQQYLAKNGQVDIVSAYVADDPADAYIPESEMLLSYTAGGEVYEVRIGFTDVCDPAVSEKIKNYIGSVSDNELASLTVSYVMESDKAGSSAWIWWLVAVGSVLLIAGALVAALMIRARRRRIAEEEREKLAAVVSRKNLEELIASGIPAEIKELYYIAHIGVSHTGIIKYYGEETATKLSDFIGETLKGDAQEKEYCSRLDRLSYVFIFKAPNRTDAEKRIHELIYHLNTENGMINEDYRILAHAGIYHLNNLTEPADRVLPLVKLAYKSAEQNDDPYVFATKEFIRQVKKRELLERETAQAVKRKEILFYIQYVVDTATGRVCGAEAISRWEHPREGLLMPGEYIDLMRQAKTISLLDYYMFEKSCQLLERWGASEDKRDFYVSCNFDRLTVAQPEFYDRINAVASRYKINRANLVLEITEETFEYNRANVYKNIARCRKAGFALALDDFGSGSASFQNLIEYDITHLKLDRSFIDIMDSEKGKTLLTSITTAAHAIDLSVVLEGVETPAHYASAKALDINYIQGFLFSRVVPLVEADRVLSSLKERLQAGGFAEMADNAVAEKVELPEPIAEPVAIPEQPIPEPLSLTVEVKEEPVSEQTAEAEPELAETQETPVPPVVAEEAPIEHVLPTEEEIENLDEEELARKFPGIRYRWSFIARLHRAPENVAAYYTEIKNAFLKYKKVRSRISWSCDTLNYGRAPLAKFVIKPKSLYLYLALDPRQLEGSKYFFDDVSDKKKYEKVPVRVKVRSRRGCKYAVELVEKIAETLGLSLAGKFAWQEYKLPYETIPNLIARELIKVDETVEERPARATVVEIPAAEPPTVYEPETPAVPELTEEALTRFTGFRYRWSFTARLHRAPENVGAYYSDIKNAFLKYKKVRSRISWSYDSINYGKTLIARFTVKQKSLHLYLALDPRQFEGTKYFFDDVSLKKKYEKVPMRIKVRSGRGVRYALELVEKLAELYEWKLQKSFEPRDHSLPQETIEHLIERELIKVNENATEDVKPDFALARIRRAAMVATSAVKTITEPIILEDNMEEKITAAENVSAENAAESAAVAVNEPAIEVSEAAVAENETAPETSEAVTENAAEESTGVAVTTVSASTDLAHLPDVRYRWSFTARLHKAPESVAAYYTEIKNAFLKYRKVKARMSWSCETVNFGRVPLAKFVLTQKSLLVFLALDPKEFEGTKYFYNDLSDKKKYEKVPMRIRVRSPRGVRYVLELIEKIAEKCELKLAKSFETANYALPDESIEKLLELQLIKVIERKAGAPVTDEDEDITEELTEQATAESAESEEQTPPAEEKPVSETAAEAVEEIAPTAEDEPATETAEANLTEAAAIEPAEEAVPETVAEPVAEESEQPTAPASEEEVVSQPVEEETESVAVLEAEEPVAEESVPVAEESAAEPEPIPVTAEPEPVPEPKPKPEPEPIPAPNPIHEPRRAESAAYTGVVVEGAKPTADDNAVIEAESIHVAFLEKLCTHFDADELTAHVKVYYKKKREKKKSVIDISMKKNR